MQLKLSATSLRYKASQKPGIDALCHIPTLVVRSTPSSPTSSTSSRISATVHIDIKTDINIAVCALLMVHSAFSSHLSLPSVVLPSSTQCTAPVWGCGTALRETWPLSNQRPKHPLRQTDSLKPLKSVINLDPKLSVTKVATSS